MKTIKLSLQNDKNEVIEEKNIHLKDGNTLIAKLPYENGHCKYNLKIQNLYSKTYKRSIRK